ncbi:MAG: MarR family transcriptional regulator [Dysgonomonas sp.]|nr:MarR family transcriptional regulator [Dysgonomonas sp.]
MEELKIKERQFSRVDNLMWKATKLLTKKKKLILEEFGLSCSQFDILSALYQSSKDHDDVIQVSLSEKTNIDPMTTSTVLRNLEKRGLIRRERGRVNTRTVEVELTESGMELYDLAYQKIETLRDELYQNLDQQQLTTQLQKLTEKLNK